MPNALQNQIGFGRNSGNALSSQWQPNANDLREDGTRKGKGWLGQIPMKSGQGIMTEMSIGVDFGGKGYLIPAVVPTLTQEEIDHLAGGNRVTDSIMRKAVEHAKKRIQEGKSPFID